MDAVGVEVGLLAGRDRDREPQAVDAVDAEEIVAEIVGDVGAAELARVKSDDR